MPSARRPRPSRFAPLRRGSLAVAVAAAVALAGPASLAAPPPYKRPSGEPSVGAVEEARARYSAGNRAVQAGRWADALADFERAYALSGVPAALFNLATTLRALGRHVEARDAFDQLLASHPDMDPATLERARSMREEAAGRVATLRLEELPPRRAASVFVDGRRAADDGARPLDVELDPGAHELRVEKRGARPFRWTGELGDGESRTLRVRLEPERAAPAPSPAPAPRPAKGSGGILASPVFWTVVGVVVVGGAAGAYWGLEGRDRRLDPGSPNVVRP